MRKLLLVLWSLAVLAGGCYYPDDGDPSPAPGAVYEVSICPVGCACPALAEGRAPMQHDVCVGSLSDPAPVDSQTVYHFDEGLAPTGLTVYTPGAPFYGTSTPGAYLFLVGWADAGIYGTATALAECALLDDGRHLCKIPLTDATAEGGWDSSENWVEFDTVRVIDQQAILDLQVRYSAPAAHAGAPEAWSPPGWYSQTAEGGEVVVYGHQWPAGCGAVWGCPADPSARVQARATTAPESWQWPTFVGGTTFPGPAYLVPLVTGTLSQTPSVVGRPSALQGLQADVTSWEATWRPVYEELLGGWPLAEDLQIWDMGPGGSGMESAVGFTSGGNPTTYTVLHEAMHAWFGSSSQPADPLCDLTVNEAPATWLSRGWTAWAYPTVEDPRGAPSPQLTYDAQVVSWATNLRDRDGQGLVVYPAAPQDAACAGAHGDVYHAYKGQTAYLCGALWFDEILRAERITPDAFAYRLGELHALTGGGQVWTTEEWVATLAALGASPETAAEAAEGWLFLDPHAPGGCLERADQLIQTLRVRAPARGGRTP